MLPGEFCHDRKPVDLRGINSHVLYFRDSSITRECIILTLGQRHKTKQEIRNKSEMLFFCLECFLQ